MSSFSILILPDFLILNSRCTTKTEQMEEKELTGLSDLEIVQRIKKIKNNNMIDAAIIGFSVGVVIYSVVKNGFGLFAFLPLLLAYLIARNSKNNKILEKELQEELKNRNRT